MGERVVVVSKDTVTQDRGRGISGRIRNSYVSDLFRLFFCRALATEKGVYFRAIAH